MRRDEKNAIIDSLAEKLKEYSHFYLTDTAQLNAADTSDLRRKCFENEPYLSQTCLQILPDGQQHHPCAQ